jgi:hypothetical protein
VLLKERQNSKKTLLLLLDTLPENPSFGHKKSPVGTAIPSGLNQHKG